ncbi:MAG: purine-cytosine permease family protein [Streptosporangiaceae bacterium]
MYLGFAIEGGIVAGDALAGWLHVSTDLDIVVFNVILLVIALIGYNLIHLVSRVITIISGIVFLALFIELAMHVPAGFKGTSDTAGTVLLAISIFVAWQVTWAPYVSDYSRYLPENTPPRATFGYTYIGSALGATVVMVIGALAAAISSTGIDTDAIGFLGHRFPAISALIIIALLLGLVPAGAEGPYGAFLTAWSAVSASGKARSIPLIRTAFVTAFTAVATLLAILAGANVLSTFENITLFLLYLLVPWTAINLTDYYLVRRGNYDVGAMFDKNGKYGRCNWVALVIYAVSIGVEIPFINSTLYVGPLVKHLGGADIAWIIGIVVASVLYYVYARASYLVKPKAAAVAA